MTNPRELRAYGLWSSLIGADAILGGTRLGDVAWDDDSGQLLWFESSQGHGTLFVGGPYGENAPQQRRQPAMPAQLDAPRQLTTTLNIRGRLGYGGGEFTVAHGHAYFAADEGRLHRQAPEINDPKPITPAFGAAAAPVVHPSGRFVAYVHSVDDVDRLALVAASGDEWPHILAQGADFYMHPSWHPDGTLLAYVSWNYPDMPWDSSMLHVARFDESAPGGPRLRDVQIIAGGATRNVAPSAEDLATSDVGPASDEVSVMQPRFSPDGRLLAYISDATGFWQLYAYDLRTEEHIQLTDAPFEHGVPAWVQGQRTYAFTGDGLSIYYIRNEAGFHRLMRCTLYDAAGNVDPRSEQVAGAFDEYAVITQIAVLGSGPAMNNAGVSVETGRAIQVAFIGSGPATPPRIVVAEMSDGGVLGDRAVASRPDVGTGTEMQIGVGASFVPRIHVVRRSQAENFIPGSISMPEQISWSATDGTTVHGLYYPPANPRFTAEGLPPAVISIHGGPTSQSLPEFNGRALFFTSRGYAYVEPNYRGSTGFGRAYRNALHGNWGVVDVEDALGAGAWLTDRGRADGKQLVIMGGSAGGYTALRALSERPGFFKAAINMYGVADLFGLAMDTHKFERRYTDRLVGPLPEAAAVYRKRSPVFHADKIRDAVAVFQGTEDNVVPKSQSDAVVAALRQNGVPCEYHVYEGEGHGWRRSDTVRAVYDAIDKFLQHYVTFA